MSSALLGLLPLPLTLAVGVAPLLSAGGSLSPGALASAARGADSVPVPATGAIPSHGSDPARNPWPVPDRFAESIEFEVSGVDPTVQDWAEGVALPVRIPLGQVMDQLDIGRGLELYRLDETGTREIPLQAEVHGDPQLVFLHEPGAGSMRYLLRNSTSSPLAADPDEQLHGSEVGLAAPQAAAQDPRAVECWRLEEGDDGVLRASFGGRTVLGYCFASQLAPGVPQEWSRSCYVHPWLGPEGENLLDDFPADHLHHRGVSWMWPRVIVDGEEYDLWTLRGVEQRFESFGPRIAGSVFALVEVTNGWYLGERRILEERVRLCVYRPHASGPQKGTSVFDVRLEFLATESSVELAGQTEQDKGYGGFGFRMAPAEDVEIVTSRGVESVDCLHDPFAWASYSARLRGADERFGVAALSHPTNPGTPNPWMLRHYGYCGESWPGLEPATLEPGVPLALRYRMVSFRGRAGESANLPQQYRVYEQPLGIRVLAQ